MRKQVCVTGLGTIGLPIACLLVAAGYAVHGVDIDDSLIARIQSGSVASAEPDLEKRLKRALEEGHLTVSQKGAEADIHLLAVPTLLDLQHQPNLAYLQAALKEIQQHLRSEDLVLIESSCPIGTTEWVALKLREKCPGVSVAYCPERVLPGNIFYELVHNDRVIGGIDPVSTSRAVAFYQSFVQGEVLATQARIAEAVKIAENTYRDINIAYANELSMIADQMGVNIHEVIRLANRHPRVDILQPGPGVGGHCISVIPWFLASAAPGRARLTMQAREINQKKTEWVLQKVRTTIRETKARVIACLGLTYKANVSDLRHSPALQLVEMLGKEIEVIRIDPFIIGTSPLEEAFARADIVVGLVAHSSFKQIPLEQLKGKVVLDFAGIWA